VPEGDRAPGRKVDAAAQQSAEADGAGELERRSAVLARPTARSTLPTLLAIIWPERAARDHPGAVGRSGARRTSG